MARLTSPLLAIASTAANIAGGPASSALDSVGTPGDDVLTGARFDDTIRGLGGNDILDGRGGDDVIDGGKGDDAIYGGQGADQIDGGRGDDELHAGGQNKPPSEGGNSLSGGQGVDILHGGFSRDTLDGGTGNDTIFHYGGSDVITGGAGDDAISMGTGAVSSAGCLIQGDAGDDLIVAQTSTSPGTRPPGSLAGGTGSDQLTVMMVGNASDDWFLDGGEGRDTLEMIGEGRSTDAGQGTLLGGEGDDVLTGGFGRDILDGGADRDVMDGGAAADVFRFLILTDSSSADPDTIRHLKNNDTIDLSAIDADVEADGDQAFALVADFTGAAGQLRLRTEGGSTLVEGDVDGDGVADFTIETKGAHSDFLGFVL